MALALRNDWAQVVDPVERRRIQNRVHQREWRRKKRAATCSSRPPVQGPWMGQGVLVPATPRFQHDDNDHGRGRRDSSSGSSTAHSPEHHKQPRAPESRYLRNHGRVVIPRIVPLPSESPGRPFQLQFPLSPDHYLLTLIQYNVKRAFLTNLTLLGLMQQAADAHCDVFALGCMHLELPTNVPPLLKPTALQKTVPYSVMCCTVPMPVIRDNMILNYGKFDPEDLVGDLYGGIFGGFSSLENQGVMVWGDPWLLESWEVTEAFANKWHFLLDGCPEVIKASNAWRAIRGEDPMRILRQ